MCCLRYAASLVLATASLLAACSDSDGSSDAGAGAPTDAGAPGTGGRGLAFGNSDAAVADGGARADGGHDAEVGSCADGDPVEALDLLFVVDDSQSMLQEQAALRAQFPRLIRTLVSGERLLPDGTKERFTPAASVHLGVVSSDMGLIGIQGVSGCVGLGDDGVLQHAPTTDPDLMGCADSYPPFLEFQAGGDEDALAQDFQCIATLGINGCGFEQPLEAGLKALWPAVDTDPQTRLPWIDPATGAVGNRVGFLSDGTPGGEFGHGDGANDGFLQGGAQTGRSLIGVVVVTDEEDCSSRTTRHLTPGQFLQADDPLREQPINLRCYYNEQNLYGVERYINSLRALRPGNEDLVVFAAIAGVPADLVQLRDGAGVQLVDLADPVARARWYDTMMDDPRMQQRVDESVVEVERRGLVPSCGGQLGEALAYPPRRIVEVARGFGENGMVQSICQEDFTGAMDAIVGRLSKRLGTLVCPE